MRWCTLVRRSGIRIRTGRMSYSLTNPCLSSFREARVRECRTRGYDIAVSNVVKISGELLEENQVLRETSFCTLLKLLKRSILCQKLTGQK